MKIVFLAAAVALALTACGGSGGADPGTGRIAGEITVLTHRTDIVDTVYEDYKRRFKEIYPEVTVNFEAVTDYDNAVRIRMNTTEYGDVLMIPGSITIDQMPDFFEPLGPAADLSRKYRFINEAAFGGTAYGLAITGNASGFVYNKRIWKEAGIAQVPRTPEEFLAGLQAIKDRTKAVPLYTNYGDGWPLGAQWTSHVGAITAEPATVNRLADTDAPWTSGSDLQVIDSLLFDAVARKLIEPDPATTKWELSKSLIGSGEIATMGLGSWAIVQMQQKATNAADIGYMPFPAQVGGKFHTVIAGDYKQAININSKNKPAARAWLDFFADNSNYATDQGGISPLLNGPDPTTLADFAALDVQRFELAPQPAGREDLQKRIDRKAEIGVFSHEYRQRIVDAARGARPESKEQVFADLNKRWAAARANTK